MQFNKKTDAETKSFDIGPCNLYYGIELASGYITANTHLPFYVGQTQETTIEIATTYTDITTIQGGTAPVDRVITSVKNTITTELNQVSLEMLQRFFPNLKVNTEDDMLYLDIAIGTLLSNSAKELLMIPIISGANTIEPIRMQWGKRVVVTAESITNVFNADGIKSLPVVFDFLPFRRIDTDGTEAPLEDPKVAYQSVPKDFYETI